MTAKQKINSVIVLLLAILFAVFFDSSKHNASLSPVNPFADDPYDAIGTFAMQTVIFLGAFAVFRAFRPYQKGNPSTLQKLYLVRTQMAVVLGVLTALAGDLAALIRHASLWIGTQAGMILVILLATLVFCSMAAGILVHLSVKDIPPPAAHNSKIKPILVLLIFFTILIFYPERITEIIPGALFTVMVGALLLFMMIRSWGGYLYPDVDQLPKTIAPKWVWGVAILTGIALGFLIVFLELGGNGGTVDIARRISIILIYIGLEVGGILLGYGFLGKFLGIFQYRIPEPPRSSIG